MNARTENAHDSLQAALQRLREIFDETSPRIERAGSAAPGPADAEPKERMPADAARDEPAVEQAAAAADTSPLPPRPAVPPQQDGLQLSPADARHLLNLASQPEGRISPPERQLALDMLTLALITMPRTVLEELVERVCHMEAPPLALVRALLTHAPAELRQRLLADAALPERVLGEVIATGTEEDRRTIAGRRALGPTACAALAERADAATLRRLLENDFARPGDMTWRHLMRRAHDDAALLAPMLARSDLPVAVAHVIFWPAPTALRRRILLRHGSESAEMERLLALADPHDEPMSNESLMRLQAVCAALEESDPDQAISLASRDFAIAPQLAGRILRDRGGEALLVLLKARGASPAAFRHLLELLQERRIARRWAFVHELERLEDLFGRISRNRARMALLYWEWHTRALGPYAGCAPPENEDRATLGKTS